MSKPTRSGTHAKDPSRHTTPRRDGADRARFAPGSSPLDQRRAQPPSDDVTPPRGAVGRK
jgi:hypothetical protein